MKITFDQAFDFLKNVHTCVVDQTHLGRLIIGYEPNGKPFIIIDSMWHRLVEEVDQTRPVTVTKSGSLLLHTERTAIDFPIEILALTPKRFR